MASYQRIRHWKQRFDKNANFIWRRKTIYAGVSYDIGDDIPDDLYTKPTKLRTFWESKVIELRDFVAPDVLTGEIDIKNTKIDEIFIVEDSKSSYGTPLIYYYRDEESDIGEWIVADEDSDTEYAVETKEQAEKLAIILRDEIIENIKNATKNKNPKE